MFKSLNRGQVRLLHIHPGTEDQIACDLEIATLASSVNTYDALSYCWGSAVTDHSITLSEESYAVTSNLYGALKHLRRQDGQKRVVWIDAVCINQQDHEEQTQQVNMMADIYRNARLTVMWLGEEITENGISVDGVAFSLLEQLRKVFDDHGLIDLDFQRTGPEGLACPGYGLPNTGAIEWIALARLFSKPYFERIWIVQEVVMATKAMVACGRLRAEWELVRDVARSVRKCGSLGNLEYDGAAPGVISVNIMADLKGRSGIDLLSLLVKTRAYQSSKEVDKVFALMNVASNSHDTGIEVDYSMEKEPLKVWERLALHSLFVHKSLLCLSNAGIRSSPQQSWVPNWSDRDDGRACLALYGKDQFAASRDTKPSIRVSEDRQILTVAGYIVDSIAVVAPPVLNFVPEAMKSGPLGMWLTAEENEKRRSFIVAAVQNPLEIAKSAFRYSEGVSRDRELVRTLCCDLLMTGEMIDINAAYRAHQWIIQITKTYLSTAMPEDLAMVTALQRDLEATKPSGVSLEEFMHSAVSLGTGRSVCATTRGDLGRVAFGARPGDLICIFKGGIVPYVLREEGSSYRLVGECFMNGIMYGEALERNDLVEQEFGIR